MRSDAKIFKHPLVKEILEKYRRIWALSGALSLLAWDRNTYMPEGADNMRSVIEAENTVLLQELVLDKEFVKLVQNAYDEYEKLNDYEKGVIRVLKRQIDYYKKLPPEFVREFTKLTAKAFSVWKKAKPKGDFESFAPYLEKIFNLARKKSEYLGYKEHPYDAHLDLYEEGLIVKDLEEYWSTFIPALKELFQQITNRPDYKADSPLEKEPYNKKKMQALAYKVLKYLGFNSLHSRLDVSAHPFTISIGAEDVRITSWYHDTDFRRSFSAVVHEWGHALHALLVDKRLYYTPIEGHGDAYAVAESQSRFMENIVGRNPNFLKLWLEDFYALGENFKKYDFEEFVHYFNLVRPSLIRVEADEVTYHFHIFIRYNVEKSLLEGTIKVSDLPRFWEEQFMDLLKIEVPNHTVGVLQDVHWSEGYIGYFPTYSMGTVMSMQLAVQLEKELNASINELVGNPEGIKKVINFLREKIHQYGSMYPPKELMTRATGRYLSPDSAIEYLKNRYL